MGIVCVWHRCGSDRTVESSLSDAKSWWPEGGPGKIIKQFATHEIDWQALAPSGCTARDKTGPSLGPGLRSARANRAFVPDELMPYPSVHRERAATGPAQRDQH